MSLVVDPDLIGALRADLQAAQFTVTHLSELLGPVAAGALQRDQVVPAELHTRGNADPAAILLRLFTLGDPVDEREVAAALPRLGSAGAAALGLVRASGDALVATCDLRPYGDEQHDWWVASDLSEVATRAPLLPEHVLGIGGASTTLAAWTPRPRARRALDLGTGCGVQALHLGAHVEHVVATDISAPALAYAAFNAALNEQDWELRAGSLLEPVAGERFDLIVSNPPFVITPRVAELPVYEYRDAGARGDAVVEHLVTTLGEHLEPGGIAQLLGNWEIAAGADWRDRVGAWARAAGVDVWVVQREVQDPAQYAETWARDGGHRSGTAEFAQMYAAWLADFAARDVAAVGFGIVTLHRPATQREPFIDLTEARGPVATPMGPAILAGIEARVWLAEHGDDDVLATAWSVAPDITVAHHLAAGASDPTVIRLTQGGGLGRTEDLDTASAAYVSVADGELTARVALAAIAGLLDVDQDALIADLLPRLRRWIADGILR